MLCCRMVFKSLGRRFYKVQESYLSKSSLEVDFGVTVVFLVHFRAKGRISWGATRCFTCLPPSSPSPRKTPHFSYEMDCVGFFFFSHEVWRGEFCSGGILDVNLLFLGTNRKPVLVKLSGIALCFGWLQCWVKYPARFMGRCFHCFSWELVGVLTARQPWRAPATPWCFVLGVSSLQWCQRDGLCATTSGGVQTQKLRYILACILCTEFYFWSKPIIFFRFWSWL